jgi:hypothetical protein
MVSDRCGQLARGDEVLLLGGECRRRRDGEQHEGKREKSSVSAHQNVLLEVNVTRQ